MNQTQEGPTLFPEPPDPDPSSGQAPNLLDQFLGVFTEPVPLFRRLADQPRWGWAMVTVLVGALASGLAWAARVDADALLRPALAANPQIPPDQLETMIAFQGRFLGVIQAVGALVLVPALTLFLAGCFWLVARLAGGPRPGYSRALCAVVVPSLVAVPRFLLVIVLCFTQVVGGRTPDQMSPLSLGAWLGPDRGWPAALLNGFDLFALAYLALLFLAARHTLRLRAAGALACVAISAAISAGMLVLGAR